MGSWQKLLFINSPEIKEKYMLTDNDYRVAFFIFRRRGTHMFKFCYIHCDYLARVCKLSRMEAEYSSKKLLERGLLIKKTKQEARCNYDFDPELKKDFGQLVKKYTTPTTEARFKKKCGKVERYFDPSVIRKNDPT